MKVLPCGLGARPPAGYSHFLSGLWHVRLGTTKGWHIPQGRPGQPAWSGIVRAVKTGWAALSFVPEKWRSRELCPCALGSFPWVCRLVPEKLRGDKEIYLAVVSRHGGRLAEVHLAARDMDVCVAALSARRGREEAVRRVQLCTTSPQTGNISVSGSAG